MLILRKCNLDIILSRGNTSVKLSLNDIVSIFNSSSNKILLRNNGRMDVSHIPNTTYHIRTFHQNKIINTFCLTKREWDHVVLFARTLNMYD